MDRFIVILWSAVVIANFALKSNMDRFIGKRGYEFDDNVLPLKSNMDRFIAKGDIGCYIVLTALKSNMDRFIGL